MKKKIFAILTIVMLPCFMNSAITQEVKPKLVVIAHPSVELKDPSRSFLKLLFLRKKQKLSDGTKLKILTYSSRVSLLELFTNSVLKMTTGEYQRYWIQVEIANGLKRPKRCRKQSQMLRAIATEKGSIGFVTEKVAKKFLSQNPKKITILYRVQN